MRKPKDPGEVVATLKGSIEVSPRKSRRLRSHALRSLFGWPAWTAKRKDLVAKLLDEQGILPQPTLTNAGPDDWIMLSMPVPPVISTEGPAPWPDDKWFDHLMTVSLSSEREVEVHFASPLFHQLHYEDMHEAAGLGFLLYEGSSHKRVEADLVYFADADHSLKQGTPLVLVETKSAGHKLDTATEQAKSYANRLRPAYYVVTDGDSLTVWNYQGAISDDKVMDFKREELRDHFDAFYRLLNRETAIQARKEKIAIITGAAQKS